MKAGSLEDARAADSTHKRELNAVVGLTETAFVGLARGGCFGLRVLLREMCRIPGFHSGHGMIGSSKCFFRTNRDYPIINSLFVR